MHMHVRLGLLRYLISRVWLSLPAWSRPTVHGFPDLEIYVFVIDKQAKVVLSGWIVGGTYY
jgi:hypothetical protein